MDIIPRLSVPGRDNAITIQHSMFLRVRKRLMGLSSLRSWHGSTSGRVWTGAASAAQNVGNMGAGWRHETVEPRIHLATQGEAAVIILILFALECIIMLP